MKKITHTLMLCLGLVASTCMALSCMSENNTTINNEYCSISFTFALGNKFKRIG